MSMRYAALCSGIGGLELAVEAVFDCELAWHAEVDKDAVSVHDRHWPGVPNVGDITSADWSQCEPVELMCFGFPCQDLSSAGKGAGIVKGTRSGLWFDCLDAVRVVRPRVVIIENVSALVTRRDGLDFTIVMSGLAEAGFDAEWVCVRASDVGAPHRRERVFVIAWDRTAADASRVRERPDRRVRGRHAGELLDGPAHVPAGAEVACTEDAGASGGAAADASGTRRKGRT